MEPHTRLSNTAFEKQFREGVLPPALFTHEAHLRLAWLYITQYGVETATQKICTEIKQFTVRHGALDKFNQTVTVAAVKAVYHFILKSKTKSFREFITAFPRLKYHFKDLMAAHYSFDIYNNPKAKQHFLPPDIEPFDE